MEKDVGEAEFRSQGHNPEMALPSVMDNARMLGVCFTRARMSRSGASSPSEKVLAERVRATPISRRRQARQGGSRPAFAGSAGFAGEGPGEA
jgi:hypothetical protein